MIKRFTTHFTILAMAVFAFAVMDIKPADAHKLRLYHNHGGFSVGIGHGIIGGGIYLGKKRARRSHCHGSYYCHKHKNRGYHSHNKRGIKVYPRSTAPRYHGRRNSAHVNWCINRYRSYDIASDTFQPYHGPRKYCRSPY